MTSQLAWKLNTHSSLPQLASLQYDVSRKKNVTVFAGNVILKLQRQFPTERRKNNVKKQEKEIHSSDGPEAPYQAN